MPKEAGLFTMPDFGNFEDMVGVTVTNPLPSTCSVGFAYTIEGNTKLVDKIATPPWVYAEVRLKKWYEPEAVESVDYIRGFPNPFSGDYSIDLKFKEKGSYEVTILISPAPFALPVIGVKPVLAKSETMSVEASEEAPPGIDFVIGTPAASPETVKPGEAVSISSVITSNCTATQTVIVKCLIYEGSILPGHGTLLQTLTSPSFNISPGESYNVEFSHTAVKGTIDRRDVGVEVYIGSTLIKEGEWDDVYYVKETGVETETLEVDITPSGSGWVSTSPAPLSGVPDNHWDHNDKGQFAKNEDVQVTAHPAAGYEFEKWSDEIEGGVNYNNPAMVKPMTEYRAVKAHFVESGGELESPNVETLTASDLKPDGATLRGQLYGIGDATAVDVYFEYGKTTSYGSKTSKMRLYPADDYSVFQAELSGLSPLTTYHFRAVVDPVSPSGLQKGYGSDNQFTTLYGGGQQVTIHLAIDVYDIYDHYPTVKKWQVWCDDSGWDSGVKPIYQVLNVKPLESDTISIMLLDENNQSVQYDSFPYAFEDGADYRWVPSQHKLVKE